MAKNRIRELRERKRITLEALAEKVGVTHGYLSRIERGKRGLSIPMAERIAMALDVHTSDVAGLKPDDEPAKGGFKEDVEPYTPGAGEFRILAPKGENIVPWKVKGASLDRAGVLPGTVVFVNISAETVEQMKPLAKVLAQRFKPDGTAATELRQFLPPSLLVTNSHNDNREPLDMDVDDVHVRGIIVGKYEDENTN